MKQLPLTAAVTGASVMPLRFDSVLCIGCARCVEVCPMDVLLPPVGEGQPPVVAWPGECWYCGACVMACPRDGAIRLRHPLMNQARFIAREELGTKEAPLTP